MNDNQKHFLTGGFVGVCLTGCVLAVANMIKITADYLKKI